MYSITFFCVSVQMMFRKKSKKKKNNQKKAVPLIYPQNVLPLHPLNTIKHLVV